MATLPWSLGRNALAMGIPDTMAVDLPAAADVSEWVPGLSGEFNVLISGGTTFTVEVHRSVVASHADAIVVGSQVETERAAAYKFAGSGWMRVRLSAVTGGPVTVRITR